MASESSLQFSNFVKTTLNADINAIQTTFIVADSSNFPTLGTNEYFYLTLRRGDDPLTREVVRVNAYSGATITSADRGLDGTTATTFSQGDTVLGAVSKIFLDDYVVRNPFVHDTTISDQGDPNAVGSVKHVVDKIAADQTQIQIAAGTYNLASATTIPANVKTKMEYGAKINLTSGALTINGPLELEVSQAFNINGGSLVLPNGARVNPYAFGAVGDGATDDSQAFVDAIASMPSGGILHLPRGAFLLGTNFSIPENIVIQPDFGCDLQPASGTQITLTNCLFDAPQFNWITPDASTNFQGQLRAPIIYGEWFGAKTGSSNNSFNALTNALRVAHPITSTTQPRGGIVELGPGEFYISQGLSIGDAVEFRGNSAAIRTSAGTFGTILRPTDSWVGTSMIEARTQTVQPVGVKISRLGLIGSYASGNVTQGINLGPVKYAKLEDLFIEFIDNQGIYMDSATSGVTAISRVLLQNCVQATGLGSVIGALHILSFDNYIKEVEATTSSSSIAEGRNRVAIYNNGANNYFENIQAAFSEDGFRVGPSGGRGQYVNVRADRNYAHGFRITVGGGAFSSCQAFNNSQGANNTYDGFSITANNNSFAACKAISTNTANLHRYGFYDNSGNQGNRFEACQSTGHGTDDFYDDNNRLASIPNNLEGFDSVSADDATPDVRDKHLLVTPQNTAETQITNFDNQRAIQLVGIRASAETKKSWIAHDNTNFRLKHTWYPRLNDTLYLLSNNNTTFNEIGRSDRGRASIALFIDSSEYSTQTSHNLYPMDDNATIVNAFYKIQTPFTSATNAATIQLGVQTVDPSGILAAVQASTLSAGFANAIPQFATPGTWTTQTSAALQRIQFTIAGGEDLTAGAMWLFIDYVIAN